jgi:hypothetical protein
MRQKLLDDICGSGSARDFEQSAGKLAAVWAIQVILEFLENLFEGNTADVATR